MDKKEARKDLMMLHGDPPYNSWSNICYGDGYFAASLVRKYGMSLDELAEKSGYKSKKLKVDKVMKKASYKSRKIIGV